MTMIHANWPVAANIEAFTTTRLEGYSISPYQSNNLAFHVGDDDNTVYKNRLMLQTYLSMNAKIEWLDQTHSTDVIRIETDSHRRADAMITKTPNTFLAILTADCLPIMLAHNKGLEVANIHAGWRGLLNGIIQNTVLKLSYPACEYSAYIGPAICHRCFEVGEEVKVAFMETLTDMTTPWCNSKDEKWLLNLSQIAEYMLHSMGLKKVIQSNLCTYENDDRFFSYRLEGQTGRIASVIGIQPLT